MNDVTLSGLINGAFEKYGNDGTLFKVLVGAGNKSDDFTCLAYGEAAKFLTKNGKSGQRVVFQGRLGSEKLDGETYQSAITVGKVLAISDSESGFDTSHIVVSGEGRIDDIKHVGSDDIPLVNINIANYRHFKKGDEVVSYKTFINGSAWRDTATSISAKTGGGELPIIVSGGLRARSYEKDGQTIEKIDVTVFEAFEGAELAANIAPSRTSDKTTEREVTPKKPAQQKQQKRSGSIEDDLPF